MDDDEHQVKRLLTRAADEAGPFMAPPVEELIGQRPRRRRARPVIAVGTVAAAVVAVAVGLSAAGSLHTHGQKTAVPTSTASPLSLPGPSGPNVALSALQKYRWSALPAAPIPARGGAAAAWTGQALIVWGGQSAGNKMRNDGATYNPSTRTWTTLPTAPLNARTDALSVWVNGSFVVWGGTGAGNQHLTDGARYDVRSDTWAKMPRAPVGSYNWAQLVAAGDRAVLLSAADNKTGIINADAYDPATNTWRAIPDLRTSPGHRVLGGEALGVGNNVFVWSDWYHATRPSKNSVSIGSGVDTYALDIRTRTWSSVPLKPDRGHDVQQPIWTGRQFLLAGEDVYCGPCSHPGGMPQPVVAIDLRTGARTHIPTGPLSTARAGYYWTGSALLSVDLSTEVIGSPHDMRPGDAAAWDPSTSKWTRLASTRINAGDATVWTGTRLLVWGFTGTGHSAGMQFAPAAR